jgi:Concanavalin A-like lectin/glucanases superfamily
MRLWVVIVFATGCFSTPPLRHSDGGDDDGGGSGSDGALPMDTMHLPAGSCPAPNDNDLLAYYALDEGSGGVAGDGVGAAAEGAVSGAEWTSNAHIGGGLRFNASTDAVSIQSDLFDQLPAITVCAWFQARAIATNGTLSMIILDKSATGLGGWNAYLNSNNEGTLAYVAFYTNYGAFKYGRTPITLNTWQHACMTWDGTQTRNGIHVYLNGVEDGEDKFLDGGATRADDSNHSVVMGRQTHSSMYPFLGELDEVQIYRRVLNASEIDAIYHCL